MDRRLVLRLGLVGLDLGLLVGGLYMVLVYVPTAKDMGVVQRIFYLHVPLAWVGFLAFFVVFVGSIMYLWRRGRHWDIIAHSSSEIGMVFITLMLVSGSIWAKAAWGAWWIWEPRLTSSLVLWLIYIAYILVRSLTPEVERGARFAAVVGVVGFVDVPIVVLAVTLWRTHHSSLIIFEGGVAPAMMATLMVCLVAFTILYALLLMQMAAIRRDEEELARLRVILR